MRTPMRRAARGERGLALISVLLMLGLMLLAAAGAMRAVDTGNVVAGNFSFKQAATQAADRAMSAALGSLALIVPAGAGNTAVAHHYYATRQSPVDSRGFPNTIDWSEVACIDPQGAVIASCATDTGEYRIQYVIERMCSSNPDFSDITDIRARCEYEASASALSATSIELRYRVILRVRGPRGTESWFEAMVSGPAST